MKIQVTQEHIDRGVPINSKMCPVAIAVRQATGEADVSVGPWTSRVGNKRYETPKEVSWFIGQFDTGVSVRPFEFEFNPKEYMFVPDGEMI